MEKNDVSSLLGQLEPTTEYGEFLKLWPDIKETLKRQVNLKAIFQALKDANLVTVSYVTFTRFVKKVSDEEAGETAKVGQPKKYEQVKPDPEANAGQKHTVPSNSIENPDKSATIATPVAEALKNATQVSTQKNYAKNVRER